jgi:type III secretory pathway component EscT
MPTGEVLGPLALVGVRLFAILRMQPLWRAALGAAWIPVAAGLAAVLGVVVVTRPDFAMTIVVASLPEWIALAALEFLLGTVIGALASLPGHALLGAAGVSAGLLRTSPRPFVALTVAIAMTAGLAGGLHHALVEVLTDGFRLLPPGLPATWIGGEPDRLLPALLVALDGMLVLGLCFAAPVLLTMATVRIGLGSVALGPAPAHAVVDGLDAWLALALALVALGASWAVYPHAWARALLPS